MTAPFEETEIATPAPTEVRIRRRFAAPPEAVFRAHTEPALVRRWLTGPPPWEMPDCEIDLRPGGSLRYVWRNPETGESFALHGVWVEVAPQRLVHTEIFEPDRTGGGVHVTTEFEDDVGGGALLTMRLVFTSEAARDGAVASGMQDGIAASHRMLDGLASLARTTTQ